MSMSELNQKTIEATYAKFQDRPMDDIYLALANSLRYCDSERAPVRGFGDDVQAMIEWLRGQIDNVIGELCKKYCERKNDVLNLIQQARDLQGFVALWKLVSPLLVHIGLSADNCFDEESTTLLVLLLRAELALYKIEEKCPPCE